MTAPPLPFTEVPKVVFRKIAVYRFGGAWIGSTIVLALFAGTQINFLTAVAGLGLVISLAMLFSLQHEIRTVHVLVNSQRTEMLSYIAQLITALETAGVVVPRHIGKQEREHILQNLQNIHEGRRSVEDE